MSLINQIEGRQILDSRGKPTVEVKVTTDDGLMGIDSVPSGTSTGEKEAVLIETNKAITNINNNIRPKLIGKNVLHQEEIDKIMINLDGTQNKSNLGANSILGVSLAVARVGALANKMPLYWHINKIFQRLSKEKLEPRLPTSMMVMICGGKHGQNDLCIQEFLVLCQTNIGIKIWHTLEDILKDKKIKYNIGLEGAFSPQLEHDEDALELISEAINNTEVDINDVRIGLDIAGNNCQMTNPEVLNLFKKYNLYSIEDPFKENEWEKFGQLKLELEELKRDFLLIGDDLFATHKTLLQKGIKDFVANGIIIKVNQVGTLTEALEVIDIARRANYQCIVSHRSGETTDTFIADLAVGVAANYLKSGAPIPKERLLKYKRIEEIEQEL